MNEIQLSSEAQAQLAWLESLGDDDSMVDTSDIPEITDAQWALRQPNRTFETLVVEPETMRWFRSMNTNRDYRAAMNAVLRRAMLRGQRQAARAGAAANR